MIVRSVALREIHRCEQMRFYVIAFIVCQPSVIVQLPNETKVKPIPCDNDIALTAAAAAATAVAAVSLADINNVYLILNRINAPV